MLWTLRKKLRKVAEIMRREGLRTTLVRVVRYLTVIVIDGYYRLRGSRTLTVDGHSVTFDTTLTALGPYGYFIRTEREILEETLAELRPDDVFYDVGAYVGIYSCFADTILEDGDIVAIEPYPPNVSALKRNFELNQVDATVVPKLLWDEVTTVHFDDPGGQTTSAIVAARSTEDDSSLSLPATTGDRLTESMATPAPDVVKIDVEGAEGRVLQGMGEILRSPKCRLVVCEVHDFRRGRRVDFTTAPEETRAVLEDYGFNVTRVGGSEMEHYLIARKPNSNTQELEPESQGTSSQNAA